ncbi:hypothetical protein PLESTB_001075800 [Pleodorina starrii]|nr:hypothetical protein PLESTM_000826600 [Pleodorina starrii]GLC47352.1 hypothetical protein PLESTM_002063800 [Pleodorina starrii]GLC56168.1 hypothetical protein PLESTB_001075800 [Pleodorina starrii]GLC69605.1 hypothetical protein PLESTF_000853400 [Pleodorina starrii]GLC72689.1 hypothetical protein PLESTF_001278900 [Pleodorina starrii]
MLPLFGLEVALVAMLAGVLMMPAKRKLSDQLVELQKVYTDLQAQLTAIERSDDYQKAASLLAADPGARANKKKFTAAVSSAYDTCVALKNQMASVSANIAQLEMAMEQPALKVLVSDKSGRVMERPFKDLDYVNDSWVNKAGKEHKALKRENRELNQIYHAFQKVNRSLEDEREARRDDAPPEQMEELEKATNDAITDGENLLTDLNMRLRKAMLVGWEAVESLDLPDCCKSEEERSKLFSAHKRVAAERECERRGAKPGVQKQGGAGFRQRQLVAPGAGFGQAQVGFGPGQGGLLPHQALPFVSGVQFGGVVAGAGQGGGKPPRVPKPTDQCYKCKLFGHFANMCPNPPAAR